MADFEYVRTHSGTWVQREVLELRYDGDSPYEDTDNSPYGDTDNSRYDDTDYSFVARSIRVDPTLEVLLKSKEGVFTMFEIACALAVKEATVRRLIKDGELKAIKFRGTVRILRQHLLDFLKDSQVQPGEYPDYEDFGQTA